MKRYKLHWWSFDTRANILNMQIQDSWEINVKNLWYENKTNIEFWLKKEYWEFNFEQKLKNFKDFWVLPLSIIYYHNNFFAQIRNSFVLGAYYPSLTWVCSLWERILNHLINWLKDDFKSDTNLSFYKDVYKNNEFKSDNWEKMLDILNYWNIFETWVSDSFLKLKEIRNRKAVHFNKEIEDNEKIRETTLDAIKYMSNIIDLQFCWLWNNKKWLIEKTRWVFFIKKEYESNSFVKNIIIPNCLLVWNNHKVETINWRLHIIDDFDYWELEISDEDFSKPYL